MRTIQNTDTLLMIRPVAFNFNEQAAETNYFMVNQGASTKEVNELATAEFDAFVSKLRAHGVQVHVIDDTLTPRTPDSIFPNNWLSLHTSGRMMLYPMCPPNRRLERRADIVAYLEENFMLKKLIDLSDWEENGIFLEGTGSLILDRENKIAYTALSERTDPIGLDRWEEQSGYKTVRFHALQTAKGQRLPIYHTNVMMGLGEHLCMVCLACVDDPSEREALRLALTATGKTLLELSEKQIHEFAGNVLEVRGEEGRRIMVMSTAAFKSLSESQIKMLERNGGILHSDLTTIETLGGGSARCMMTEVFLPNK